MSEKTRYQLHRILDLAIAMGEAGDDTALNICCIDGALSITVTTFDGEYAKNKNIVFLKGFTNRQGHSSMNKAINSMKRRLKRSR